MGKGNDSIKYNRSYPEFNGTDEGMIQHKERSGAQTYANVLCVKEGHEKDEAILALFKALTSPEVKEYINSTYQGAVVPIF